MGSVLPGESGASHRSGAAELRRPRYRPDAGAVLAAFMEREGLTHTQLADRLGVDRTYVSKILSGARQIRDVGRLRQIARTIGVPPERFGLFRSRGRRRSQSGKATSWHVMSGKTLMRGAKYV